MFTIHCPVLGNEVLIWSDQVTGLNRTAHGVAAEFHCACGSAAVCLAGESPTEGRLIYHATAVVALAPAV